MSSSINGPTAKLSDWRAGSASNRKSAILQLRSSDLQQAGLGHRYTAIASLASLPLSPVMVAACQTWCRN